MCSAASPSRPRHLTPMLVDLTLSISSGVSRTGMSEIRAFEGCSWLYACGRAGGRAGRRAGGQRGCFALTLLLCAHMQWLGPRPPIVGMRSNVDLVFLLGLEIRDTMAETIALRRIRALQLKCGHFDLFVVVRAGGRMANAIEVDDAYKQKLSDLLRISQLTIWRLGCAP